MVVLSFVVKAVDVSQPREDFSVDISMLVNVRSNFVQMLNTVVMET